MNRLLKRFWPVMADLDVRLGESVTMFWVWVILTPFTITTLLSHLLSDTSRVVAFIAAVFGAFVSLGMVWLASLTIFRQRRVSPTSSAVTLAFWTVVGGAAYLASDAWLRFTQTGGDSSDDLVRDVLRYALAFTLRALLLAISIVALRETNRSYSAIAVATKALEVASVKSADYVDMLRSRYMEIVKNELEPRLHAVISDVQSLSGRFENSADDGKLADSIQSLSSSNVRRLSRIVAHGGEVKPALDLHDDTPVAVPQMDSRPLQGWLTVIPPTVPVIVVFLVLRFGFGKYEALSLALVERVATLCALTAMILFVGRSVSDRVSYRSAGAARGVGITVFASIVVCSRVVTYWATGRGDSMPLVPFSMTAHVVFSLLAVWLVNYLVFVKTRAANDLSAAHAALEHIKSRLDDEGQRIRLQLASLLHGPIQGRLALASMTMRQSIADPRHCEPEYREQIYAKVRSLLESVEAEIEQASLSDVPERSYVDLISHFERDWAGVIRLESSVSPAAQDILDSNSAVEQALVLVVEEAVMNARKHGRARLVYVSLSVEDRVPGNLVVTVVDDGRGLEPHTIPGLGSNVYDRLTVQWSLAQTSFGGAIITASIPVTRHALVPRSERELATTA